MPEADYQAALDEIWRKLRPHVEWAQGFALTVLFTRHPAPVDVIRKYLQELLSMNTLPLRQFELQQPVQVGAILSAVLASRPLDGKRPPLWLEMWRGGTDGQGEEQRRAVWDLLSRLNERRFLLERDVACPLVLILPAELRMDISSMAPDLWSVRSFTADLPAPVPILNEPKADTHFAPLTFAESREPSAAETEWRRLWETTSDQRRLVSEAAFAAAAAALERMDYAAAQNIIGQVLQVLRVDDGATTSLSTARNYSIALEFSGQVEEAMQRWEEARAAYAESLHLSRRLRETSGDTPQALRDLSVSLDNIGRVEEAMQRWEEARAAYAESRKILSRLAQAFPDVPLYRQNMAIVEAHIAALEQPYHTPGITP